MAQYANEYEGVGSALMNIGSLYYSQSEKRKEEERRRKELEDERKYQETQAEKAYQRQVPLETLKQELARIKVENAKATGEKTRLEASRPIISGRGNTMVTQTPFVNEDGSYGWNSEEKIVAPATPPREPRSPFMRVGSDLIDTTTMQRVYKGEGKAAAEKPLYTAAQLLSAKQRLIALQAEQAKTLYQAQRAALQPSINSQEQIVKDIEAELAKKPTKETATPKPPMSEGTADVKITAGGTPAEKAAFAKWTAAYQEARALGATKEEAEILANQATGE